MPRSSNMEKYESRNPLKRFFLKRFVKRLMTMIPEQGDMLEVGCGEGMLLSEVYRLWPERKLTGVDLSESAVQEARERNPGIQIDVANALDLPFEDNSFEVVLCAEVLEHLKEPQKALAELCRVSSKHVILSVPHEPWFRLGNLAVLSHAKTLGNPPDHYNHWNTRSFSAWVGGHLDVQHVAAPFPWIILKAAARD